MNSYTIAKTAFSRVFIIEGQAGPDHRPEYQSCMRAGSVSQSFGDVDRIECPSPTEYGQFEEVGRVQGSVERAASSLIGRYAADLASELLRLAKQRCASDIQVHFGKCADPRSFNTFTKALVWEDVYLTNYNTEDLGALESGENASIMENSDLSIGSFYEVLQLTFVERAPDIVVNALVDAIVCDQRTCGDCDEYSEGCAKAYVLQGGILGSPGTPPDVLYTGDGGANWGTDEILPLTNAQSADGIACLNNYVVVVSNDAGSLLYKLQTNVQGGVLGLWTEITTGIVAGGEPNDIWSTGVGAFVVGDSGYVYYCEDPTLGVSVLDAGVAAGGQNLNAVHALSDEKAVAVGNTDTIIYTTDRITWATATSVGSGANLTGVWMRTETEWWVTDAAGGLYYTKDSGNTWTVKTLPGTTISALYDIVFSTGSVGYVCGVANSQGAVWRTYNGGYDWVRLPEGVGSLVGGSSQVNALAGCINDPNFLIVAAQDALNDGVLLVGKD